jgi:predicted TIM-barrel fold metal-dependent hydrolase
MRKLITTDSHLVPPFSLAEDLPEKWRDQFPRVVDRPDGRYVRFPEVGGAAQMMIMSGGRGPEVRIGDDDELVRINHSNVCDESAPGFDPESRLADMRREGVIGAVLIDNAVVSTAHLEPEAELAWCRIVNDWMADTYRDHLDQFAPGIHLPLQDIPAAVAELERAAALGLRPAVLPDGMHTSPYSLPEWEPLWDAGASLGVAFTMHVGGTRHPRSADSDPRLATLPGASHVGWYLVSTAMAETIGWFTFSGLFEKYPGLTIVMTEGYAGWMAFAMQFFDHHWNDRWGQRIRARGNVMVPAGLPPATVFAELQAPPSFYMKRQAKATFMWDPLAIRNRDLTGLDCLLWGNDYPHWEGSFPDSQRWVEKQFAGVPEDEIDQMVRGNAAQIFGLEGAAEVV